MVPFVARLLAAWLLLPATLAAPPVLKFYTEDLPPYNMVLAGGHLGGSATEKVEAITRQAEVEYQVEVTSWARAYELARVQAGTCVFSTARTPEREASFIWIGPLAHNEGVLFALADKPAAATTLDGAIGARIGGYHSSASALYMIKRGYNVVLSANHEISLKNLLAGRLDFWLASRDTGAAVINRLGVAGKVVPVIPVVNLELYLACNHSVDEKVIQRLKQAYQQLQANGTLAAIDRKYFD